MAAHGKNFIRVRLHFDYPPPAVAGCRMCWLLADLNTCRVVADLESLIREKFGFSRSSVLQLFLQDCYLPHTESVCVVRDDDSLRVKVDSLAHLNGHSSSPDAASENGKKRQRPTEEDCPEEKAVCVDRKKKKRKKKCEESVETDTKQASGEEKNGKLEIKHKDKKKKKKKKKKAEETPKAAASPPKTPASVEKPAKSSKKPLVTKPKKVSSSDSSSSSEDDEAAKKPAAKKPAAIKPTPKTPTLKTPTPKTPSSTPTASKAPPTTKPPQTKPRPPPSSSSECSSSDEAPAVKSLPKTTYLTSTAPKGAISKDSKPQQATNGAQKQVAAQNHHDNAASSDSDSDDEIKLVIRQPGQQPGFGGGGMSPWRGRGRGHIGRGSPVEQSRGHIGRGSPVEQSRGHIGRGSPLEQSRGHIGRGSPVEQSRGHIGRGSPVEQGRGGGRPGGFRGSSYNGAREPSCHTDTLTNLSVVLQNGANGAQAAPKRDYSSLPLLAAPPQPGQKIAFKLLELTENYTPEVSEYKEGKLVSFDPTTKQIELELLYTYQAPVEPGKFDLVYQNADGSESVEYAVSRGSQVTERWDSLLEPRLII
ncbi:coilin isoform X2 [Trematomus bernacchii]|uniref:coilin isoform X2 n=1 Tax=Trematomus bernacchii TaxID=40690 RepID=UPI00146DC67F|nr:coilin isoform X2 [Trematomus bernacchii]